MTSSAIQLHFPERGATRSRIRVPVSDICEGPRPPSGLRRPIGAGTAVGPPNFAFVLDPVEAPRDLPSRPRLANRIPWIGSDQAFGRRRAAVVTVANDTPASPALDDNT